MLFSCEKVIDVAVNDAEVVYVVEGVLKDRDSSSFVKISQSTNVYETGGVSDIESATVVVYDNSGGSFVFVQDPLVPGSYYNHDFKVIENTEVENNVFNKV